jgi:hypothetical protein
MMTHMLYRCLLSILLTVVLSSAPARSAQPVQPPMPQYLLFEIFLGGPNGGAFHRGTSKADILRSAQQITALRPERTDPNRILGFSIGPVAMDLGSDEARAAIRDAFDVVLETDLAIAIHLDDYMFWGRARTPDGRLLRSIPGTAEWTDWSGTPAGSLQIGYLPNAGLAPQLCYENPAVREFATYWTRDVIGAEVKRQYDRLVRTGKEKLFAGVIAGWESNLAYGYCSLTQLGYGARNPPPDFDRAREQVLQRHIERWSKGIHDAGIPSDRIFTHLGPISKRDHDHMRSMIPATHIRRIHQSTALRAFWTAFNSYSNPGFSAYAEADIYDDIERALKANGRTIWALAEGANISPASPSAPPPMSWEAYLAKHVNRGAKITNIFGAFQGPGSGEFGRAAESPEAIAAYRKFLRGETLRDETARRH